MGQQCASQAKGCLNGSMDKGTEAGQSLLSKVNDKFTDKMEDVIDNKLMSKCDGLLDKGIDQLVDATIDKALNSAIKLAGKEKKEEKSKEKEKSELRKESATQKLKDWGISQMLITAMEQDGWLDERIWNELNKEQLQILGFADGHMALFLRGMESLNVRKDCAVKLLREWKISQTLIDNMDDENYLDVDKWKELKEDRSILKSMGFRSDDIEVFLDEFDKIDDEDDNDEYICYEELFEPLIGRALMNKVQQKIGKYWTDIQDDDFKSAANDNNEDPFTGEEESTFTKAQKVMKALQDEHMLEIKVWRTITREKLKRLNIDQEASDHILWAITSKILMRCGLSQDFVERLSKKRDIFVVDEWDHISEEDISAVISARDIRKDADLKAKLERDADIFAEQLQITKQRKQRMKETEEEAVIILKKWNISEKAIHILRTKRLLQKSKWKNIDAKELEGFPQNELNIFMKAKDKKMDESASNTAQYNDSDNDPTQILKEWDLPSDLINRLKEEGWTHPEYWGDLLKHEYYDLLDLGFRPGHISTFKRQYQKWREEQNQSTKRRKIQLLRKLDAKAVKESSILKRNIDVQNDTNELIRVRIIGERKYDSFKSSSGAAAQHASKASARSSDKSSNVSMKSSKTQDADSSKTSDKSLDVNVGVSGVPVGGAVAVGGSLGVNKKESTTQNTKTHATQDNQRDSATKAAEARRNQSASGSNTSKAAASKHQWQKVNVGFAEIMPKQTISFPVQISDPNAVVYMTIIVPSTEEKICDNVQIDADFIKVEQVKLEGAVTKIKWQPSVKPPKNPYSRSSIYAKQGIITAEGLCDYMRAGKNPVEEWIVSAIQETLGQSMYEIKDENGDMETLKRHVINAVSIAVRLNKYEISGEKGVDVDIYREIESKPEDHENDDNNNNNNNNNNNKKEVDRHKLFDLGSYKISCKPRQSDKYQELMSDEWSVADIRTKDKKRFHFDRDMCTKQRFVFVTKAEDRSTAQESRDKQRPDDNEFVLVYSDDGWYKIGQRKKEIKERNRSRITAEEAHKPLNIDEWSFWCLKTVEDAYLVSQSGAHPLPFPYFQLVQVNQRSLNQDVTFKIRTLIDGMTLYLGYGDNCLAAVTPFKDQARVFMFTLQHHYEHLNTETFRDDVELKPELKPNPRKQEMEIMEEEHDENKQLMRLIKMYIETNTNIKTYKHVTDAKENDISDQVIAIASKLEEGLPNEVLQRIYEHKLENKDKDKNDGLLDANKLCFFLKQFNFVSTKKIKFIKDSLDNAKFDIFGKDEKEKEEFIETIKDALQKYDKLWSEMKDKEDNKTVATDILKLVQEYKTIVEDMQEVHKDHESHLKKCQSLTSYADDDSDDEELRSVNKFFDVNGYNILKKWELEQFYERMVDEGWKNPLDWIHLDDWVLKQNLGFRAGHIRIFNRKYDLWVKKYNDVRRTIPAKRKGKDGVLIVAPNSLKMLEPNHKYEFTKVIVRKNATLTTKSWSPSKKEGGVLLIRSYQEIVLEEGAKIDVTGKGCWGSVKKNEKGWGPGGVGGGGSVGWFECGAGGGGHADNGRTGYKPSRFWLFHHQIDMKTGKSMVTEDFDDDENKEEDDANAKFNKTGKMAVEKDRNIYHGEPGIAYGDKELSVLHGIDYDKDFDDRYNALPEAVDRHKWALGSGGGYHTEEGNNKAYRGGNGGGVIVIICDKLVMYDRSAISANGVFACNDKKSKTRHLCAGGAAGSIYLKVENCIKTYTKKEVAAASDGIYMQLRAQGGGDDDCLLDNWYHVRGIPVGVGSCGRIRIDYHSPAAIQSKYVKPNAHIVEETERGADQRFDGKQFLQSLKEKKLEPFKLKIGKLCNYLIQSSKTDEMMIAGQNNDARDSFKYYKSKDDVPAIVGEPWNRYMDQSWTFINAKDSLLKECQENDERQEKEIDGFWDGVKIRTQKIDYDRKNLLFEDDQNIWYYLKMCNGDKANEKVLKLSEATKLEDKDDEIVLRFIRIGNKCLIVIANEMDESEKKKLSKLSNSEQLEKKFALLLKSRNTYTVKIDRVERHTDIKMQTGQILKEIAKCSHIALEKFERKHQFDESCLFRIQRFTAETDTDDDIIHDLKEKDLDFDCKQEEEAPTDTDYED